MRSGKDKRNDLPSTTKAQSTTAETTKNPSTKVQSKDSDMGSALRSVYQKTIDERIPDDLLDLLGKLD